MNEKLNQLGAQLKHQLESAAASAATASDDQKINVAGVGGVVSHAYEQLRNAAEYTQEHLLRQRAIRRFYTRNLPFATRGKIDKSIAEELIVELTQAGYLENDSQPYEILNRLQDLTAKHYANYYKLRDAGVGRTTAEEWTLDLLSVEAEAYLANDKRLNVYLQFAYSHYLKSLDRTLFEIEGNVNYELSLYVAAHRSLLKSDLANIRYDLLQLYKISDNNTHEYAEFHRQISKLYSAPLTDKLARFIDKRGAPLRVLKAMVEDNAELPKLLTDSRQFLVAYESQIKSEYRRAHRRLNKGLVKSILFLLITKGIIGLVVEIPYDLAITGSIIILPLAINMLFPIVYLLLLRLGLKIPGKANTHALVDYMKDAMYGGNKQASLYAKPKTSRYSTGFTIVYGAMFLIAFGAVVNRLFAWDFNIVQGAIFFIFLATASFLGFRLSHTITELELITAKPGAIQMIRDFFYLPFIMLGQWLSDKYRKLNIVALVLDTVIELPLKTVLRLIRQWASFIGEKKDEI